MTYWCYHCQAEFDAPQCPKCRHWLTEDVSLIDEAMSDPPAPPGELPWCLVASHWGDALASLGMIQQQLRLAGQAQAGVVFFGRDVKTAELIREQPFVRECVAFDWNETNSPGLWTRLYGGGGLKWETLPFFDDRVWGTQIATMWNLRWRAQLLEGARLPRKSIEWARSVRSSFPTGAKVIHLHPASTWSAKIIFHWKHWRVAIDDLLASADHYYILTGLEEEWKTLRHPHLLNLVGQIKTNCDVLALCREVDGTLSTANSVTNWCAIDGDPALIMGTTIADARKNYFRRLMDRAPVAYLPQATTGQEFRAAFDEWVKCPAAYPRPMADARWREEVKLREGKFTVAPGVCLWGRRGILREGREVEGRDVQRIWVSNAVKAGHLIPCQPTP
jgi:hypothetical protein